MVARSLACCARLGRIEMCKKYGRFGLMCNIQPRMLIIFVIGWGTRDLLCSTHLLNACQMLILKHATSRRDLWRDF